MWLYPVSGSIKREILYRMDGIVKKMLTLRPVVWYYIERVRLLKMYLEF